MDKNAYETELANAARWHHAQTLAHAAAWGLGEEQHFSGDQEAGTLTLHFSAGADVVFPMQIVASFDPHDRTFRWAWGNASVDPALMSVAQAARAWGEANGIDDFKRPVATLTFDALTRLVALAGQKAGCEGIYRGITDDHLSVFVGFQSPGAGDYWPNGRAESRFLGQAHSLVKQWHAENLPIDAAYERDNSQMDALLGQKDAIYERFWLRDDGYWRPCSFAWPSDHDPAQHSEIFALPRRAGGAYVVTRRGMHTDAHVLEETDRGLRITDQHIEWGPGLFWPEP